VYARARAASSLIQTRAQTLFFLFQVTPHKQYQLDLLDLSRYAKDNDGFRYCLVGVCVMTRFGYAIPCRTKTGLEILEHFKSIYEERPTIEILQTDEGRRALNVCVCVCA